MKTRRSLILIIALIGVVFLAGGIFSWKYFSALRKEKEILEEKMSLKIKMPEKEIWPKPEKERRPEEEIPLFNNTAECKSDIPIEEIVTGPFRFIDEFTSAGEVRLSGRVVTKDIKHFEEEVEKVYLEIAPQEGNTPQANFYSYFIRLIEEGNTVNARENNNLLFSLGELKDDGKTFSSTANISPLAEAKILSALKSGETISLRLQVPIWVGMGAPSNFSFACAVEFSED